VLDETEMVEILEEIARNSSNQSARIAAMRMLREVRGDAPASNQGHAALYEVANPGRVRTKAG
jgi:hypothetical protein